VHLSGAPAYALRVVCEDKIIAYSGDTEWTDALIGTANGADLFVCECFSPEGVGAYYIDYQTLMNQRTGLECRRLILTHMNDDMLRQLESLDVEGAEDGKIVGL
jgi:ribonuclease BN (tRNA processing enzyme)